MQISVILALVCGAGAGAGLVGIFNMVVTTGGEVLLWQKRTREKARPFVKDPRVFLVFQY